MEDAWFRVIGTSHIAKEAKTLIAKEVDVFAPDAVAIELDNGRLQALLEEQKPNYSPRLIGQLGIRGYLFALLGSWAQRRLGDKVNVLPGADMLAAFREAQAHKLPVLLVDRPILVTLQKLNRALGWRELRQFVKDGWSGLRGKETVTIDLQKIPEAALVDRLLREFRRHYPRPYRVLVNERNVHMARALRRYHAQFPDRKVLVVVGAGHVEGLVKLLESP